MGVKNFLENYFLLEVTRKNLTVERIITILMYKIGYKRNGSKSDTKLIIKKIDKPIPQALQLRLHM
jgi:hypothetical protein